MRTRPELLLALIAILLVAHALSYGLNVQDDAFISYRYAENLVRGHGLVFNPGEPVEGYTNFLWTLLLAGCVALGGDPLLGSVIGGVLGAVGMLVLTWRLACQLVPPERALVAPALMALNAAFALEAVQGLESTFFGMLVLWGVLLFTRDLTQERGFLRSSLVLALAALTRPEGILVFGLLHGAHLVFGRPRGAGALRRLAVGWACFGAVVCAHEAFRLAYYGQPLPNTFYAKTGGGLPQLLRGLDYLWRLARQQPMLFAAAALGFVGLGGRQGPLPRTLLALTAGYLAYVAAVGGDFKITGRFIVPVLGALAVAATSFALQVAPRGASAVVAGLLFALLDVRPMARRMSEEAAFRAQVMQDRLEVGAYLRDSFPPGTLLAIHSSGTIPYVAGFPTIDMWGLSDLTIAHREMPAMGEGMAGHEKTDFEYVFGRDPDLYVPEEDFLTDAPVRLGRPAASGFDSRWVQRSVPLGERSFNFFVRQRPPG